MGTIIESQLHLQEFLEQEQEHIVQLTSLLDEDSEQNNISRPVERKENKSNAKLGLLERIREVEAGMLIVNQDEVFQQHAKNIFQKFQLTRSILQSTAAEFSDIKISNKKCQQEVLKWIHKIEQNNSEISKTSAAKQCLYAFKAGIVKYIAKIDYSTDEHKEHHKSIIKLYNKQIKEIISDAISSPNQIYSRINKMFQKATISKNENLCRKAFNTANLILELVQKNIDAHEQKAVNLSIKNQGKISKIYTSITKYQFANDADDFVVTALDHVHKNNLEYFVGSREGRTQDFEYSLQRMDLSQKILTKQLELEQFILQYKQIKQQSNLICTKFDLIMQGLTKIAGAKNALKISAYMEQLVLIKQTIEHDNIEYLEDAVTTYQHFQVSGHGGIGVNYHEISSMIAQKHDALNDLFQATIQYNVYALKSFITLPTNHFGIDWIFKMVHHMSSLDIKLMLEFLDKKHQLTPDGLVDPQSNETLLHSIIKTGKLDHHTIDFFQFNNNVNVNIVDGKNNTLLHMLAQYFKDVLLEYPENWVDKVHICIDIMKHLILQGANWFIANDNHDTFFDILYHNTNEKHANSIYSLLSDEQIVDALSATKTAAGSPPESLKLLHLLSEYSFYLVEIEYDHHKAEAYYELFQNISNKLELSVNAQDSNGNTPLHLLTHCLNLGIEYFTNIPNFEWGVANNKGETVLHTALNSACALVFFDSIAYDLPASLVNDDNIDFHSLSTLSLNRQIGVNLLSRILLSKVPDIKKSQIKKIIKQHQNDPESLLIKLVELSDQGCRESIATLEELLLNDINDQKVASHVNEGALELALDNGNAPDAPLDEEVVLSGAEDAMSTL